MKTITYGDLTSKNTGNKLDMHYGKSTLCFNPRLKKYALPGCFVVLHHESGRVEYGCNFVDEKTAKALIKDMDKARREMESEKAKLKQAA